MSDCNNVVDKLVLSKANDTIALADKRFSPCYFGFLNEHEAQLIKDKIYLTEDMMFWGGYDNAQRVIFGANVSDTKAFPIKALSFTYKREYKLAHRDFLGSLMALGIERSTIGDIVVSDGKTIVFVKDDICEYILREVTKIGRVGVKIEVLDIIDIECNNDIEELSFTISSLRLDVFVSAVCHLSREKSQQFIKSDMVSLNYNIENNISRNIKEDDVITIRKYGKFIFTESVGFSKKGRIKIKVNRFR